MSDARWGDPREYGEHDRGDERPRVYDERDRDDHDPRDALMHDLDLPSGDDRELVVDRNRVYEVNGEDSRTLGASAPSGSCPNTTSTSTTRRSITCAMRASSMSLTLATASAA